MKLTKEIIRDLKACNAIVIRFNDKYSSIDIFSGDRFGANDRRVTYEFDGEYVGYSGNWHTSVYRRQQMPVCTFIDSLRAGDTLAFHITDFTSEILRERDLAHYQLTAIIRRHKKDGKTLSSIREWYIDDQVSLDNSARYVNKKS